MGNSDEEAERKPHRFSKPMRFGGGRLIQEMKLKYYVWAKARVLRAAYEDGLKPIPNGELPFVL
ncbi:hypothetical protein EG347_12505 [Chryseobacterium sp. G0186]|nr:hypothetical protein EG347_12505 [Chryseobacterium sp. G0186]